MRARIAILGLLALVVAAPAAEAQAAPRVPFQRGMTVGEWGPTAFAPQRTARLMRTLAHTYDVDTVTLFVSWAQRDRFSTVIAPGAKTARRRNLVQAIRSARAAGLKVILRPYLELTDNTFRGLVKPRSVSRWFAAYTRFILTYAEIARREHVTGFTVGTEMGSMSKRAGLWRDLIRKVRRRFHGFVTYQANWDEVTRVRFWDSLDAISISAYFPVAALPGASADDLVAGWQRWFGKLEALHAQTGKPVMFGEIGYRTVTTAAVKPWEISAAPFSASAQLTAYEAALRVWYRVPWFAGMNWWYLAPHRGLLAGRNGADHRPTPEALQLLGRWYSQRRGNPQ